MKNRKHIFNGLLIGLLNLLAFLSFSQTTLKISADSFVDSLMESNSDTIIEIRINGDNQKHLINFPSTYIYFKNNPKYSYKFCGKKFDNQSTSKTECNDDWQRLFDFISDYWTTLKSEKILSDSITKADGKTMISSPNHFDIVEIVVHNNGKTEKITVRKDYFLPSYNRNYKTNILTKTFIFLSLIEDTNGEVDKKNNR